MKFLAVILGLLVLPTQDVRNLDIPFDEAPGVEAVRKIEGVKKAVLDGRTLRLEVDPYARITLRQIEKAAGAKVDLSAFKIRGCAHVVLRGHGGGGGKAPCLEAPTRGCFNAGPFTAALGRLDGVKKSKLVDMRAGGDLAWLIVVEDGKTVTAKDAVDAVAKRHGHDDFKDLVLSGVFPDHEAVIPSEYLPKFRPGAVASASPRLAWTNTFQDAFRRARKENKMILLNVHHFD